jgi:arylsulfatase A-like enzyme
MKNLILISLDTVRADVAYSGKFKTINNLRNEGLTFLNTVSSSPLTPVSHATVLTGLQPYNHGIRHLFKEKLNPKVKTLAQILKNKGYKTGAIVSCPGMNKWYGFSKGFELYDDEIPKLADGSDPLLTVDVKKRGTALKRANLVIDRAYNWIKDKQKQQYFLFIHFFDAHWPYEAPERFAGDNAYEEEVAFSDYYLGVFLDSLKKDGLLGNTSIVVFSDHGEDLEGLYPNDKGGKKLGHPEEFGHGCLLYDQTQKVVLIIKDKSLPRNKNIEQQVRLVDLFPTILDLLNIKNNCKVDGVSLIPIIKDDINFQLAAYSETFYPEEQIKTTGKFKNIKNKIAYRVANKYKIIFNLNSNQVEIYDLENDKNEKNNLYKSV